MRYWLSRREGEVVGPFSRDDLQDMAARGELVGPAGVMPQVCPEGQATWRPISMVPELADLLASALAQAPSSIGGSAPALWPPPAVPGADPLAAVPFTFGNAFDLGWRVFQARYLLLLGVSALTFGLTMAGSISVMGIDAAAARATGSAALTLHALSFVINVCLTVFVNLPLAVGSIWLVVPIVRGEAGSFVDLFAPYRRLLQLVVTGILLALIVLAVSLVGIAIVAMGAIWAGRSSGAPGAIAVIGVGVVVILVPALIVAARLAPAYLLVVDPEASPGGALGPIQALKEAWRITDGHLLRLIGLGLVVSVIAMVTVLACLLPWIFFGNPLNLAVYGAAYALLVSGGVEARKAPTAVP